MGIGIMKRIAVAAAAAVIAAGGLSSAARAEFPEKPVEMTVLFGGSAQAIGQLLAQLMSDQLPNPVVAVSRTGGGGAVGYTHVESTSADGYNIVWNSNSISTSHYRGNMPLNYEDFTPIARVSLEVPALAVRSDSGWDSLAVLADAAAQSSGKLKVGISGIGSFTHLTSAALFNALGIGDKILYVPYGSGTAPVELLSGRIDAAVQWPSQFVPLQESGELTILCVTSMNRITFLPDTPSCAEAGAQDLDITMWRGLAAPAGTPPEVVAVLQDAAKAAIDSGEFQDASKNMGFTPAYLSAADFGALIATDDALIGALMAELGLRK